MSYHQEYKYLDPAESSQFLQQHNALQVQNFVHTDCACRVVLKASPNLLYDLEGIPAPEFCVHLNWQKYLGYTADIYPAASIKLGDRSAAPTIHKSFCVEELSPPKTRLEVSQLPPDLSDIVLDYLRPTMIEIIAAAVQRVVLRQEETKAPCNQRPKKRQNGDPAASQSTDEPLFSPCKRRLRS